MDAAPGWRLWLTLLVSGILASVLSVVASVMIADRNAQEQLTRVELAKQQAQVEQKDAACQLIGGILAAYDETPPPTKTGKNVADAWLDEYRIVGCLPKR